MNHEAPGSSHRLLTSLQSPGRVGKSTLKQALLSWFGYAGIDFAVIDADGEHRTLSSWYPDFTVLRPYRNEEDPLPILNDLGEASVELLDFPAQSTQSILKAFEHFNALDLFDQKQTRLTAFIFASDERAAMTSAAQIISALDGRADYVVVKNPARFTSQIFENSKLPDLLKQFEAPTIEMPRITHGTLDALDVASRQEKKALTFLEAEPMLEIGSSFELQHWRNRLFAQFEDIAHLLLPSPSLIQNRVTRVKAPTPVAINPYDL